MKRVHFLLAMAALSGAYLAIDGIVASLSEQRHDERKSPSGLAGSDVADVPSEPAAFSEPAAAAHTVGHTESPPQNAEESTSPPIEMSRQGAVTPAPNDTSTVSTRVPQSPSQDPKKYLSLSEAIGEMDPAARALIADGMGLPTSVFKSRAEVEQERRSREGALAWQNALADRNSDVSRALADGDTAELIRLAASEKYSQITGSEMLKLLQQNAAIERLKPPPGQAPPLRVAVEVAAPSPSAPREVHAPMPLTAQMPRPASSTLRQNVLGKYGVDSTNQAWIGFVIAVAALLALRGR